MRAIRRQNYYYFLKNTIASRSKTGQIVQTFAKLSNTTILYNRISR